MKSFLKTSLVMCGILVLIVNILGIPVDALAAKVAKKPQVVESETAKAAVDFKKMSDMSDFDPNNPIIPTGDTIKVAVVMPFSGPAALNGQMVWLYVLWVTHDINKRGGIWVDGKKKLIQPIQADTMSRQDQCKKICERMALQEKVHVMFGTAGSNMMKVIMEVGNKYNIVVHNFAALSYDLHDALQFNRYTFMTTYETSTLGRGLAYYFGQIRKKEKKFFVLCQDYSYGRSMAEWFMKGLKEYYPEAQVVGEDYHKLFITDFAPYLTKIKASGAEAVFTGDWIPDIGNLLKQARQLGIRIPFADRILDDPQMLAELGIEGSKGLINITEAEHTSPYFKNDGQIKMHRTWIDLWKNKWTKPYNSKTCAHPEGQIGSYISQLYWLFSVIERAKSTNAEKIIKVWENDSFRTMSGKIVKMRACDHKVIQDLSVSEFVPPEQQKVSYNIPPYYWFNDCCYTGELHVVPAAKILPWMDQKLDRCKGKDGWGK